MCGIAGYYLKDPQDAKLPPQHELESFVNELLKGIEHRGRDATGVVAVQRASTQPHLEKADIDASRFIKWRKPLPDQSRIVLLHTRAATQGSPKNLDNNHPVVHKTCYVTHNGHIRNDDTLFKDNDITRIAQVDSEAIPALIDKHGLDKVHLALQELEGGFAIAAVQPEVHPDVLVLAKGRNSPLEYLETEQGIIWASTSFALRDAWKEVWGKAPDFYAVQSLKEGELLYIEDGKVEKLEFKVKQYTTSTSTWTPSTTNYTRAWSSGPTYLERFTNAKNHRRTCTCTHSKWKHSGINNDGLCIKADCTCHKFVFARFLSKKEWKRHEDYKRVQEDRVKLIEQKKEEKARKQRIEESRMRTAEQEYRSDFPMVKGQLRLVYANGERRVFDDGKIVAVQFRCDGCTEYKSTKGRAKQGTWSLCAECWGEQCDLCDEFVDGNTLTKVEVDGTQIVEDWYLCKKCYNEVNTASDAEFETIVTDTQEHKGGVTWESHTIVIPKGVADNLTVDNMCIKLTAEELGVKAAFLYELLFEMSEAQIKVESWLDTAYTISKEAYTKNLTELRQGLVSTTSKALALAGSEDFTRPPARSVGEAVNSVESEVGVRVFVDE